MGSNGSRGGDEDSPCLERLRRFEQAWGFAPAPFLVAPGLRGRGMMGGWALCCLFCSVLGWLSLSFRSERVSEQATKQPSTQANQATKQATNQANKQPTNQPNKQTSNQARKQASQTDGHSTARGFCVGGFFSEDEGREGKGERLV